MAEVAGDIREFKGMSCSRSDSERAIAGPQDKALNYSLTSVKVKVGTTGFRTLDSGLRTPDSGFCESPDARAFIWYQLTDIRSQDVRLELNNMGKLWGLCP